MASVEVPECAAVVETRLMHKVHRAATSLRAEAAQDPAAPPGALDGVPALREQARTTLNSLQTVTGHGRTLPA